MFNYLKKYAIDQTTNNLDIYLGKKMSNTEFDTNINNINSIKSNLNNIKQNFKTQNYTITEYYHKNLIHKVKLYNNKAISNTYKLNNVDRNIIQSNKMDYIILSNDKQIIDNSIFPCSDKYILIKNYTIEEIEVCENIKILLFDNNININININNMNNKKNLNIFNSLNKLETILSKII
jgi:hypothetical protein